MNIKLNSLICKNNTNVSKKTQINREISPDKVILGENVQDNTFLMADKLKEMKNKKDGSGNWFTDLLTVRVPSTTENFSEEKAKKIMDVIQPGDIVLEVSDAYPGWQLFEIMTLKSHYTHAAIYEGNGKIIEATTGNPSGKGVVRTDLKEYFDAGPEKFEIIRPPYKTPEDVKASLDYCRAQIGKSYDTEFNLEDDNQLYCAELVYKGLQSMPNKIDTPVLNLFGKKAVGPNNFEKIEGSKIVYSDNSNFLKNMLTHYPIGICSALGAVAGGLTLGPLGLAAGGIGATLLSIATGNKIQTGHFGLLV